MHYIKFTSDTEITFLGTCVYQGERFESILETCARTSNRQRLSNLSNTHTFTPVTPRASGKALSKAKPYGFLEPTLQKKILKKTFLYLNKDYALEVIQNNLVNMTLSEVNYTERISALQNKQKKYILPFVTECRQSMPNLKQILMNKWHLIQNQPLLREIFKNTPLISHRKGMSL